MLKVIWATSCKGQGAKRIISDIQTEVRLDSQYIVYSANSFKFKWLELAFTVVRLFFLKTNLIVNFNDLPNLFFRRQVLFFHNLNLLPQQRVVDSFTLKTKYKFKQFLFKLLLNKVEFVVFQTESSRLLFLKHFPKFSDRSVVKMHPININLREQVELKARTKSVIDNKRTKPLTLFYPSSFYPHKRHDFLLATNNLLKLSGVELTLTIEERTLQSYFSENNAQTDNIRFLGTVTHQTVIDLMNEHDGLVFPSELESLGLPLVEAGLLGVPILGNRSVVSNIVDEHTYYPFDLEFNSFSDALVNFLDDLDGDTVRVPSLTYCPCKNWKSYFDDLEQNI